MNPAPPYSHVGLRRDLKIKKMPGYEKFRSKDQRGAETPKVFTSCFFSPVKMNKQYLSHTP